MLNYYPKNRKEAFRLVLLAFFALIGVYIGTNYAIAQYPGFSDPGAKVSGGGGAGLVPVVTSIDGGVIPIGATAQVVVRFRNDGAQPVQTGLIRLYPSSTVSATASMNQCEEEPLVSGAECAIALSVKGLQAGPWRVEMLMSHSGRTRLVTSTLSGNVEVTGDGSENLATDVEALPKDLDFGSLNESQTLVQPITLRNITSKPIDIKSVSINASELSGYAMTTECETLEPGQACIAIVSWSPQVRGRSSGVMVVNHTGPTAITSIPIGGEYSPGNVSEAQVFPEAVPGKGLMVSSQTELDFGNDVDTASTLTVSLVNAGDAPLDIKTLRLSGSDNGLSFAESGCSQETVLMPIEACPLTLSWSPTRIGAIFDDVQIIHNGVRGVLVLPVRGSASSTVSKDQKAIVLSSGSERLVLDNDMDADDIERIVNDTADPAPSPVRNDPPPPPRSTQDSLPPVANAASVLDGYKITSFSPSRAIINGPGGSRLIFNNERIVLGGVPWFVVIQNNGIEFLHQGQRVLLLFDRSLSSLSQNSGGGSGNAAAANDDGQ